jgi:hypothetical protein
MTAMKETGILLVLLSLCTGPVLPQTQENVGDVADGNKSVPVHLIRLYDEFDHLIRLDDSPVMPFSSKRTCRKCHDYEKIRHGWHFNVADSSVAPGRIGEPWIYVDRQAATQIPLSYRRWKGTYSPTAMGMTALTYLSQFGRHLPGGGVGEKDSVQELNNYLRWQVTGDLEINCQSCHNADPGQSQAEYGVQVLRQNFRWAATASSGFATVQGSAKEMPDNFDLYSAVPPEKSEFLPPTVAYNKSRFDAAGKVLFNVPRKMPSAQCSFCHSSKVIDPRLPERWETDEDVHIAAGMTCVDCHRNGLDHQITRGYEGEAKETGRPAVSSLTCEGCHMGSDDGIPADGRRGAPRPRHLGIPPVHFDRLACTACHSGPWPSANTMRVKTSRAHSLGIPKADKTDDALPQIMTPVFANESGGKYAPHNVFWPSFWAHRKQNRIEPLVTDLVRPLVAEIFAKDTTRVMGRWPVLSEADILYVLRRLRDQDSTSLPVYIGAGKLFNIGPDGKLESLSHEAATPYLWPVAHDVRPRAQSLGVRGCADCHATDAPFHFGSVVKASPYFVDTDSMSRMTNFQDKTAASAWLFSMSFLFRPGLKAIIIFSFVLIALVVLIYTMRGLAHIIRILAEEV